ncbi:hypothetical protein LJR219_003223 [Phenylobacterium sp. LjRoot219]|uniref:hypothetical protein n=1 Tax=Phenylobacterium sp. LjRoot219 TaxID=3342283 RepID=UPI003ECF37F9
MKARLLAIGAVAAALAATTAGAASMDVSRDIQAKGAKPDWSLKVTKGTQFTLARAGKPAVKATAPGAAISSGGASWQAKTADGQPMKVSVENRACTLGQNQYPMTAQVTLGAETLSGCAN